MLKIIVPGVELWDAKSEEFTTAGDITLDLEHSLVSLSKWESKFEKPFLRDEGKSEEDTMEYVKAMILTPDFPPEVLSKLTPANIKDIDAYINAKQSATFFRETIATTKMREQITSELIYYWMIAFNIPFECQFWHLNRLFTLIRVCNVKNAKPKKMGRAEMLAERQRLNAQRRAELGSTG